MSNDNSALTGPTLKTVLEQLARICVIADSLRMTLEEPLSEEDKAAGAEELTSEQIQQELESIARIATAIAITDLKADSKDWYAATDSML